MERGNEAEKDSRVRWRGRQPRLMRLLKGLHPPTMPHFFAFGTKEHVRPAFPARLVTARQPDVYVGVWVPVCSLPGEYNCASISRSAFLDKRENRQREVICPSLDPWVLFFRFVLLFDRSQRHQIPDLLSNARLLEHDSKILCHCSPFVGVLACLCCCLPRRSAHLTGNSTRRLPSAFSKVASGQSQRRTTSTLQTLQASLDREVVLCTWTTARRVGALAGPVRMWA